MSETVRLGYTGTALPTGATTVVLFDTVTAFQGGAYLASLHMKRLVLDLVNSQAGTLNWYKSRGHRGVTTAATTWVNIGTQAVAIAAPSSQFDWLVEEYEEFKLEWVNGGVTQTVFDVDLALSDERVKST